MDDIGNNTPKQEKAPKSENTTSKSQTVEETNKPDIDINEKVKNNNKEFMKKMILKVKEIGKRNNESDENIVKAAKEGILNYFESNLKLKKDKIEFSNVPRNPLINGNVVIVCDEKFDEDFTKYIEENEFMPF